MKLQEKSFVVTGNLHIGLWGIHEPTKMSVYVSFDEQRGLCFLGDGVLEQLVELCTYKAEFV